MTTCSISLNEAATEPPSSVTNGLTVALLFPLIMALPLPIFTAWSGWNPETEAWGDRELVALRYDRS